MKVKIPVKFTQYTTVTVEAENFTDALNTFCSDPISFRDSLDLENVEEYLELTEIDEPADLADYN